MLQTRARLSAKLSIASMNDNDATIERLSTFKYCRAPAVYFVYDFNNKQYPSVKH